MKSIKKDVENLSFSSLALTESAWEALVVLYKDWPVWLPLARSCASGWDSSSLTAPDDIWHHREENQQPSKHQDQTSHTATSCVLCWRGLGNASPAAQQKKNVNLCITDPSHSAFTAKAGYPEKQSNPKRNHSHSKMFPDISCTPCLLTEVLSYFYAIFHHGHWIAPIDQNKRCETEEKGLVVAKNIHPLHTERIS